MKLPLLMQISAMTGSDGQALHSSSDLVLKACCLHRKLPQYHLYKTAVYEGSPAMAAHAICNGSHSHNLTVSSWSLTWHKMSPNLPMQNNANYVLASKRPKSPA